MAHSNDGKNKSQKQSKREKERRNLIRAILLYFFGLFIDLYFVWPKSHVLAIIFCFVAIAIHLLTSSWSLRIKLTFLLALIACTSVSMYLVPPNETNTQGFLTPANDPSPQGPCNNHNFPGSSFVYFGSNEAVIPPGQKTSIIRMEGRKLLYFTIRSGRLEIGGDIYGSEGELAHIANNKFTINPNTTFRDEHPDRHTLVIRDNMGTEYLRVRYLNPHAVTFTGHFFFPGRPLVIVTNRTVSVEFRGHYTSHMGGVCVVGASRFINIR